MHYALHAQSPIPVVAASAPLSLSASRKPGRAAEVANKAACYANELELLLLPSVESTGGCWGKACDDFFKKVLKAAQQQQDAMNESVYSL
jgi:hypothetical protein